MRDLPPTVETAPTPADFTTPIEILDNGALCARVRLGGLLYELGLRPTSDETETAQAREVLRNGIWQLMELERAGRPDLMDYASATRHASRPRPQLTSG